MNKNFSKIALSLSSVLALTACNERVIAPVYTPDPTYALGQDISNDGPYAMYDKCAVINLTNKLRTYVRGSDGTVSDEAGEITSGTIYNDFYDGYNQSIGSTYESLQWTIPYKYVYEHSAYYPTGTQLWQMDYATMDLYLQDLELSYPYASRYAYTDYNAGTFSCFYYYNVLIYNGQYTGNYPGGRIAAPEGIELRTATKRSGAKNVADDNKLQVAVSKFDLLQESIDQAKKSGKVLPFSDRASFIAFRKSVRNRKLTNAEADAMALVSKTLAANRDAVGSIAKKYEGKIDKMVLSTEFAKLPDGMKASMKRMYDF
ncbi:MAG: hypothetical protein EOP09_10620, partial [Proteobacteria bacterium]